jgi:hypothetical protein
MLAAADVIILIAFLTAFVGGLIGPALACRKVFPRALAFILPVFISTGLLSLSIIIGAIQNGTVFAWPPIRLDLQTIGIWFLMQCSTALTSVVVTGVGWFCSWCVRVVFE